MAEDFNKMMEKWEHERQQKRQRAKADVLLYLADHHPQIAHIAVRYDGYGDEGYVNDVDYFDNLDDGAEAVELKDDKLAALIDGLFDYVSPDGFEINYGGDGEFHVYPATQKIIVNHNQNIVHQEHESYEA